jgi:hypothetical protein
LHFASGLGLAQPILLGKQWEAGGARSASMNGPIGPKPTVELDLSVIGLLLSIVQIVQVLG